MTGIAMERGPALWSSPFRLGRAIRALRSRVGKIAKSNRYDARIERTTVAPGSIVRVFDVDTLREVTTAIALGPHGQTPGRGTADAPMSAALLGAREGETRAWDGPSGPKRVQVVAIVGHEPESPRAAKVSQRALHRPAAADAPSGPALERAA